MHTHLRPRRLVAALAAAVGLLAATPGVADAAPADPGPVPSDVEILGSAGDWTRFAGPYGFVYGVDFIYGDDYYVIPNGTIEEVCGINGPDMPVPQTGRLRQRSDGRWTLRDTVDQQLVHTTVYEREGDLNIFQWFDTVCPAAFGGEALPAPVASGMTDIYFDSVTEQPFWFTFDESVEQPVGRYSNGTRGVVDTADGGKAYLISEVRYTVTDEGFVPGREFIKLTPID